MPSLDHAEFAVQGGGSRRFTDETSGPRTGYYVSRHPEEGGEKRVTGDATAVDVAAHWSANRHRALEATRQPSEAYQGLWKHDGTSYLDVSNRVSTRSAAVTQGLQNNQRAVYDANRGASLFLNKDAPKHVDTPTPTLDHPVQARAHYRITSQGYQ